MTNVWNTKVASQIGGETMLGGYTNIKALLQNIEDRPKDVEMQKLGAKFDSALVNRSGFFPRINSDFAAKLDKALEDPAVRDRLAKLAKENPAALSKIMDEMKAHPEKMAEILKNPPAQPAPQTTPLASVRQQVPAAQTQAPEKPTPAVQTATTQAAAVTPARPAPAAQTAAPVQTAAITPVPAAQTQAPTQPAAAAQTSAPTALASVSPENSGTPGNLNQDALDETSLSNAIRQTLQEFLGGDSDFTSVVNSRAKLLQNVLENALGNSPPKAGQTFNGLIGGLLAENKASGTMPDYPTSKPENFTPGGN